MHASVLKVAKLLTRTTLSAVIHNISNNRISTIININNTIAINNNNNNNYIIEANNDNNSITNNNNDNNDNNNDNIIDNNMNDTIILASGIVVYRFKRFMNQFFDCTYFFDQFLCTPCILCPRFTQAFLTHRAIVSISTNVTIWIMNFM